MGLNFLAGPRSDLEEVQAPETHYGLISFDGSDRRKPGTETRRHVSRAERRYEKQVDAFRKELTKYMDLFPGDSSHEIAHKRLHTVAVVSRDDEPTGQPHVFVRIRRGTKAAEQSLIGQGLTIVVNEHDLFMVTNPELGVVPPNFNQDGPLLNLSRLALEEARHSVEPA